MSDVVIVAMIAVFAPTVTVIVAAIISAIRHRKHELVTESNAAAIRRNAEELSELKKTLNGRVP